MTEPGSPVQKSLTFGLVKLASGALASGAGAQSGSSITSALNLGERNPTSGGTAAETKVIGDSSGWVTRQSNVGAGGAAIYGCRAPGSGTCLRATHLKSGQAFVFTTRGPVGGAIRVGTGGDEARPFSTNATGVATGLNADRLDGHHADDFMLKGGAVSDATRLGGRSADEFLAANGTAVNSAKLGGRPADQFLAADGKAANSASSAGSTRRSPSRRRGSRRCAGPGRSRWETRSISGPRRGSACGRVARARR